VVEEISHEAHDVRMDFIVTPEGIQATKPNPSSSER
jgi:5-formyltetrahydrofolate cyclo-ligase